MSQDELITKTRDIQARRAVSWDGPAHYRQLLPTIHHRQRTKRTLIRSRTFSWASLIRGPHPDTNKRSTGLVGGLAGAPDDTLDLGEYGAQSDNTWAGEDARAGRMVGEPYPHPTRRASCWSTKKRTKRHVSKRNIHNNSEMFSLHRLDDGLIGGLDCGLVGALDDAQVVLAVDWAIERTTD